MRKALFEDFTGGRSRHASFDNSDREEMVNLLMESVALAEAYRIVMDAKAELGSLGEV